MKCGLTCIEVSNSLRKIKVMSLFEIVIVIVIRSVFLLKID